MAEGGCRAADDEWQMADDEWQMADDEWQMADDEWQVAGGEPKSSIQNPQSRIQNPRKTPQKAPNEAKLESTQDTSSQGVESQNAEPEERERSQSAAGGQVVQGAGNDWVETIVSAGEGGGKARGRKGRSLPKATTGSQ